MLDRARQVLVLALFIVLAGSGLAQADGFVSMPGAKGKNKAIKLQMVKYEGSTNGVMVVQVKNTAKVSRTFEATGLFFVPKGDPEAAPQRLGASGPFVELAKGKSIVHQENMVLQPGETKTIELEVFCIDSHRSSPSSSTEFRIAKNKLPSSLRRELSVSNKAIYSENAGDLSKAKPAVQSNMWRARDKQWVPIEGERAKEKAPQRNVQDKNHYERLPIQRNENDSL